MVDDYPDFEGPKAGLFLKPEWAAKEGTDKNFYVYGDNVGFNTASNEIYTVPSGKTLYITQCGFSISATLEANGDLNQIGRVALLSYVVVGGIPTDIQTHVSVGGQGGASVFISKPIVIAAGRIFQLKVENQANHTSNIKAHANGYEV